MITFAIFSVGGALFIALVGIFGVIHDILKIMQEREKRQAQLRSVK